MKSLLAFAIALFPAATTKGQGSLLFVNSSATLISTNSVIGGPTTGLTSPVNNSYYYALLTAPAGTTDPTAFVFTGLYATNRAFAGALGSSTAVEVPGVPIATTASFLVRGWSANIGNTYDALTNYLSNPTFDAWYGESQIGTLTLGAIDVGSPNLFGTTPGRIPGFILEVRTVPEPTSMSVAGLGLAAMWLVRRRSHRFRARGSFARSRR